ncbi:hypothetical protein PRIPAC_77454, partial [Pristionchus pacificus]|uniref:Uncharacterized protein n=1 Tax=Pristionchus pacificus TaxID=54126 RepID=A0A2A6CL83_PRIPA|eukprot:PDM78848.1 hypothetical protein PRIPAC_31427 [Pristionchus pacificus]
MKVSKVSEKIIKDFKTERFDEIRRNIADEITNDGLFPDLQAEMKKKIEELVGDPSATKYGLRSRAKIELAEKNSTLEAIAQSRTVDNTALYEQMRAEISARVRARLGLPPKDAEKPAQEKVPNPEKDTIKRAVGGCDSKGVMIDVSDDGIAHLVSELTVEEQPRRTPVGGRQRTPLMDPGRTPEGDLQPLGPDYAEDSSVPQKYCCPGQESTTGGRTRERDSRNTPEGHLEPLGPEEERKPLARTLERDPRHTPEGHVQPVGPDYGSTPKRNPKYNRKDRRRALLKAARRTIGETRL